MEMNPKYQKLGGWLVFFIITYSISVLSYAGNMLSILSVGISSNTTFYIIDGLFGLSILIMRIASVVTLTFSCNNPKKFLLAEIVLNIASTIYLFLYLTPTSEMVGGFIGSLVWPVIWVLYFSYSKRVDVYCAPPLSQACSPASPPSAQVPPAPDVPSPVLGPDLPALAQLFQREAADFERSYRELRPQSAQPLHDPANVLYAAYTFAAASLPLSETETGRKLLQKAPDPHAALSYVDDFVDAYNCALDAPKEDLRANPFYGISRAAQRLMGVPYDAQLNLEIAAGVAACAQQAQPLLSSAAQPVSAKSLNHCMSCGVIIPEGKTHCVACRKRLQLDDPAPAAAVSRPQAAPSVEPPPTGATPLAEQGAPRTAAPIYAALVLDEASQARAKLRYCKYCGLEMGKDVMVCPNCGKRARWLRPIPSSAGAHLKIFTGIVCVCLLVLGVYAGTITYQFHSQTLELQAAQEQLQDVRERLQESQSLYAETSQARTFYAALEAFTKKDNPAYASANFRVTPEIVVLRPRESVDLEVHGGYYTTYYFQLSNPSVASGEWADGALSVHLTAERHGLTKVFFTNDYNSDRLEVLVLVT